MFTVRERADHITVTNARGIHGDLMADYVMGGITVMHWDFRAFLREQADKKWNFRMVSPLADKSLGVIGLGSVGSAIARRAKSAGMAVLGTRRNASQPVQGVDQLFAADALKEMLSLCDFVVVAVPSTSETVGLLGAAEFACMRRTAFLLNVARGNVIVEKELIDALQAGTMAGAMLDVFECEPLPQDSPLWNMPNVIVTSHVSGMPTEYVQRAFAIVAENIERFLSGRALMNVVDLRRGY
jgi:phosphoglycerate dehydrogenase-like enzyme